MLVKLHFLDSYTASFIRAAAPAPAGWLPTWFFVLSKQNNVTCSLAEHHRSIPFTHLQAETSGNMRAAGTQAVQPTQHGTMLGYARCFCLILRHRRCTMERDA